MCCCCDCPEVERTCWRWSVEKGSKFVAVFYLIEGIFLTINTVLVFFKMQDVKTIDNQGYKYFLLIILSIFCTLYFVQTVSSAFLLIGLTVKENTAFIRIFLIFNYLFIVDDAIQLLLYILMWGHSNEMAKDSKSVPAPTPIDFVDVITILVALPFSIYSQILVSSHYKQVRRAVTGPVQTAPDQEEGFVNKYLRF